MEDNDNNAYVSEGDIVSPKLSYKNSKFYREFFDYGIAVDLTPTEFVVIQDIFGNRNYMKLTEIDKIGN